MTNFNFPRAARSVLLLGTALILTGCAGTSYTPAEKELIDTMGASKFQPRTQLEREAVETQDMFAQAAFWSREYDLNPGDLEAAVKLSSSLRKMGNPTQALEIAKTARAMFPRDTNLIAEYAASLIALEHGKDAIAPLSTALRSAPNMSRLWSLLGAAHDQIGQYGKAREHYGRALQLSPNAPSVLANVGLSYALEGDARTAEIWLRRAAQNPQASASVRQNLALVLGLRGKYSEAESLAREDLSAEGAENNVAYMRSLQGGGRTYQALQNPQAQPGASRPASHQVSRAISRPATQQAPRRAQVPASRQMQMRAPSPVASPSARRTAPQVYPMPASAPNVTSSGGARQAAMAAAQQIKARGNQVYTQALAPQSAAQKDVLAQISSSLGGKQAVIAPRNQPAQMQAPRPQSGQWPVQQNAPSRRPARRRN
ncbi:MAG: tetratricopeptide repeat protein [Robiginitomaculum sp.]